MLVEAFQHPGFAFVNDFSPCVTYNRFNTYEWFRDHVEYVPADHDVSSKDAAWALVREFASRGKVPLGVVYRKARKRRGFKRLPMWEDELANVDLEPVLATFR
jgi:2-oxoglutarate ferredoxin oxidoreductase subunit beta